MKHYRFDDEAVFTEWAGRRGNRLHIMFAPDGGAFPPLDQFDLLILLGGPMSSYDDSIYPWLVDEKRFLKSAIEGGKPVLGICLGAQILADVLGGSVRRNGHKEIGWYEVRRNGRNHPLFDGVPEQFQPFHWHGDCIGLPDDAVPLASSDATLVQAFAYGSHVLGLQFHLETTHLCLSRMAGEWKPELTVRSPYIQQAEYMLNQEQRFADSAAILNGILDRFEHCIKPIS